MRDNVKIYSKCIGRDSVDWTNLAQDGDLTSCCEHGNEPMCSIKCWECCDKLRKCWLLHGVGYLFIFIRSVRHSPPPFTAPPLYAIHNSRLRQYTTRRRDKCRVTLSGSESHYSPATSNCGYPCIETADICRV